MMNHGVLNLLKPPGMTSHDAVAHVRRVLQTKRVGHTGTLDPAAAGVLPICIGQATRLVEALQNEGTKGYYAEATFGYETDTLDATGKIMRECEASLINRQRVEDTCEAFRGAIEQEPPMHSAIKIGGQKLYDIARAGGEIKIPLRAVTVFRLEVTRFFDGQHPRAFLRIECSSGTYIRSLVRDIGRAMDNTATMTFLTRTSNGLFALENAFTPEEFEDSPLIIPLADVLEKLYGSAVIDNEVTKALWQGKRVISEDADKPQKPLLLWTNREKTLWALAARDGERNWKPEKVFDLRQD